MNIKTQGNILKIVSGFDTALWVAGLILGNIYLVLLAIIIVILEIPVVYVNRNNLEEMFKGKDGKVMEDERSQMISDKAANMTLGIFIAVSLYAAIIMVALRDVYPQWAPVGYTLLAATLGCGLIFVIARIYYGRKY